MQTLATREEALPTCARIRPAAPRIAGPSTVQVLEGEVRFRAGEERHLLSAGGMLILEGNVPYEAEALSDAAFLHTLVRLTEARAPEGR
jgi:quercetin dioxygenase-like cupin family protein